MNYPVLRAAWKSRWQHRQSWFRRTTSYVLVITITIVGTTFVARSWLGFTYDLGRQVAGLNGRTHYVCSVRSAAPPQGWHKLEADVTEYGVTGNVMANGLWPFDGAVAVSNTDSVPLGSHVWINGRVYVVADRTAHWVDYMYGLTFDVFTADSPEAMQAFGRQHQEVYVQYLSTK